MIGTDNELQARILTDIFVEVFKTGLEALVESGKWLIGKGKEIDLLGTAASRYSKELEKRYNMIRIFGMDEPIPLRSIYVRVNILEKITARQKISIDDLQQQFNFDFRSFGTKRKTLTGGEAVNSLQKFIVLGKPGAGKTTFLKHTILQSLDGNIEKERIPIFIGLKVLSDSRKSLLDFIVEQFDICNFPDAEPFVKRALEGGKCQLLLDGLDEVSKENEDYIIQQIRDFSDKYGENQFILSCRIAAYNYWFEQFTDVEIADFNEDQIRALINNWFKDEPNVADLCWEKLNKQVQIKELASIPLLLTLFCLAFDQSMEFPQNRAELYKEAVDALLKRWDASRRIKREEIYKHLSLKRKESLFSRIAAETFEKGMYFFPQHTLERSISQFVEHLPEARGTDIDVDCEAVLRAIEAQHGIFVQRAKGIYSYSHLTFQEYFTAKYIVDNAKKGTLENLVENHLFDKRWREVFLLTSGMLDEADEFLMLIKSKVETLKEYPTVVKLLDMVQRSIKDNTLYSSAFCRTLAFVDRINQARIHVQVKNQEIENENQRDYELEFDLDNALDEAIEFSIEIALADASASCLASALEHAQEGVRKRARAIEIEFFPDSEREASSTPKLRDDFTATQLEKMRLEHQKTKVDSERSLENALERVLDRSRTLAIRRARERLRRLTLGNWSASPNDTDRSLEGALERSLNRARYLTLEIDRDLEKGVGLHEVSEYLKVNKLLVDCLNAEAYISRSTRKKILDELLTFS